MSQAHDDFEEEETRGHIGRLILLALRAKFSVLVMLLMVALFIASWNDFQFNRLSEPTSVSPSEVASLDEHTFVSVRVSLLADQGLLCPDRHQGRQHMVVPVAETDSLVVIYPHQEAPVLQAGPQSITGRLLRQRSNNDFGENSDYSADVFKAYGEAGRSLPNDLVAIAAGRSPDGIGNSIYIMLIAGAVFGFILRRLIRSY